MNENQFVMVDEDGHTVYVSPAVGDEEPTREFTGSKWERRLRAEEYARTLAAKLKCSWGTNY